MSPKPMSRQTPVRRKADFNTRFRGVRVLGVSRLKGLRAFRGLRFRVLEFGVFDFGLRVLNLTPWDLAWTFYP